MYFGRTTWGGLIDLIPSMTEYHLSRFIVGVHAISMFLVPIGIWWASTLIADVVRRFFITKRRGNKKLAIVPPYLPVNSWVGGTEAKFTQAERAAT